MKKALVLTLALVLVLAIGIGGTVAWLSDSTESVVNTFTIGNIGLGLTETTGSDYKMTPGANLGKDPTITVEAGSEGAFVFVKVEKAGNLDNYISFTMADGWTALAGVDGVYYRSYTSADTATEYAVLANNQVTVLDTVTGIAAGDVPTLTFTAYAIQASGFTAETAWAEFAA